MICLCSLMESKSTQIFQFDQQGNLYILTLAAGCTGPTKLVKPGDELIFNSSYNPSDWGRDEAMANTYKDRDLPVTCLGEGSTGGH